jgi:predicted esterase YcpF (UPF0227 family)
MQESILYLHGLNSSGGSAKAALLRERLTPVPVLAPTFPAHRPREAVQQLSEVLGGLTARYRVSLFGSSMGGFYGQHLARRFPVGHLYLVNPALRPWDLVPQHLGEQQVTASGERYELTMEVADATRAFAVDRVCDGVPTTLFLDRGDQVIDYRIAMGLHARCGRLVVFDAGSHQFEHMDSALALIRADFRF